MKFPVFVDGYHAIPTITGRFLERNCIVSHRMFIGNNEISLYPPASSPFEAVSTFIFLGIKPRLPGFIPPTLTDSFDFMAASLKAAPCLLGVTRECGRSGAKDAPVPGGG
jgi:hypothetical protein